MPMREIQSPDFKQALLRSERLRILGLLGAVLILWLVSLMRTTILHSEEHTSLWLHASLIAAIFIIYELFMLRAVHRALGSGRELPSVVWGVNMIIETSLPAVVMALVVNPDVPAAYRPLATAAPLTFFLFIILSTLRLNPRLSYLTGLVASVSYLAAALSLGWVPRALRADLDAEAQTAVPVFAAVMFIGGLVAGAVAREIRKHVHAALREAEVRREMERLQRDMDIARSIQQGLLPGGPPHLAGYEIAGWSHPADKTGGDYFDWQELPDGSVIVMLADVTGHGIGPALLAAVCRAYARASFGLGEGLRTSMERINRALLADLSEGRFVTFVAAACRPGSGRVQLLSAGHGPLFVYHLQAGATSQLDPQGLPFGIVPDFAADPPHEIDLLPGDMIVLATDGFFEWVNSAGEQFGTARLAAAIRSTSALPPREIIAGLYDAVVAFSAGTPQKDDLTAVIIKRTGVPGP